MTGPRPGSRFISWRAWRAIGLVLMAAVAVAILGCSDEPEAPTAPAAALTAASTADATAPVAPIANGFPLTVTDTSGVEVEILDRPRAIISYSPGATESLFAIGAGDQVVAVDRFSNYPPAAASLAALEYSSPDPEAALSFEPDLVILSSNQSEQVEQFRNAGMTVIDMASADSLEQVYEQIELLGLATGHVDEAAAVVEDMQARIAEVTSRIADVEQGPRVFFELTSDLYSVAPDSFVGGLIETLKGQNVAAGAVSQFPQLTAEAVIAADPEVVFLADAAFGESLETVGARPGWDAVAAVVEGRVVALDADASNRPGPRLVDAIEAMARAMYPDRFE